MKIIKFIAVQFSFIILVLLVIFINEWLLPKFSVFAQTSGWSSDSSVNTPVETTSSRYSVHDTVALENGETIIMYAYYLGGRYHIQKVGVEGSVMWSEDVLVGYKDGPVDTAQIIYDGENGVYMVWDEVRNLRSNVYITRIGNNGEFLLDPEGIRVSNRQLCEHAYENNAISDTSGNAIITWTCAYGSANTEIFMQKVDRNGNFLLGTNEIRASFQLKYSRNSIVDVNDNDEVFVIWQGQHSKELGIQKFNNAGEKMWGDGLVIGELTRTSSSYSEYDLLADGQDGVFVAARLKKDGNNLPDTYIQRLNKDGNNVWNNGFLLGENVHLPDIVKTLDNNLFIVWPTINSDDPVQYVINLQKIGSAGEPQFDNPVQVYNTHEVLRMPRVDSDNQGGILFGWSHYADLTYPDSEELDIYAQRIDENGNKMWGDSSVKVSSAPKKQLTANIAIHADNILFTWTDTRNGNEDIYVQKVNFDGTLGGDLTAPTPTPEPCVLTHFPKPLTQTDTEWGSLPYGGIRQLQPDGTYTHIPMKWNELRNTGTDTIADWGCNLTSHAMNINYYAILQNVIDDKTGEVFQTDPYILNDWLSKHDGYGTGAIQTASDGSLYVTASGVSPGAIVRYAIDSGVSFSYEEPIVKPANQTSAEFVANNTEYLNQKMCELKPAMLRVDPAGPNFNEHYVSASGIATVSGNPSWRIHNPLDTEPQILNDAYNNEFQQIRAVSTETPESFLEILVHSPVEYIITDPQGRRLGVDPLTDISFDEIPGGYYMIDSLTAAGSNNSFSYHLAHIDNPVSGEYEVRVIGTGEGEYTIESIKGFDEIVKLPFILGQTKQGVVDTYHVTINQDPKSDGNIARRINVSVDTVLPNDVILYPRGPHISLTIYSTPTFDATELDVQGIVFGPNGVKPDKKRKNDRDYNQDGLNDLYLYFKTDDIEINSETTELCFQTKDENGLTLEGCDDVSVVNIEDYVKYLGNKLH